MAYDPDKHNRQTVRLQGYDYTADGAYFLTICVRGRACVFGEIQNGFMKPSRRGHIAMDCWRDIPNHRKDVRIDEFVVMPNHVHGIIWIERQDRERATQVSPLQEGTVTRVSPMFKAGALGAIVGAYKAAVSRAINRIRPGAARELWQSNYFEHIIRNDEALAAIREYIHNSPKRWEDDAENPAGSGKDNDEQWLRALIETHGAQESDFGRERATLMSPLRGHHD